MTRRDPSTSTLSASGPAGVIQVLLLSGPSAGHGRAVLAQAGRMRLLDKDYGSRRGRTGRDGRSA